MLKVFLAFVLALSMSSSAFGQGSDFNFFPNFPPVQQPFIPGPNPAYDYTYGSTMGEVQTLWGVKKGDRVWFDFVIDWYGLGPLSASPRVSPGDDLQYMEGNSGVDPWRQWVWPGIGYFCFRCTWAVYAGDDNPRIWIDYLGSSQWAGHLEVRHIDPAPPVPVLPPLVSEETKNRSRGAAVGAGLISGITATGFGIAGAIGEWRAAWVFGAISVATGAIGYYFDRIANDPWDPDYGTAYWATYNQELVDYFTWSCEAVRQTDEYMAGLCGNIAYYSQGLEAYAKGAAVAIDRIESCKAVGAGCETWQRDVGVFHLREAGNLAIGLAYAYWDLYSYLASLNYTDENDITNQLWWHAYDLYQVGVTYTAVN